jgi:hypothetical protein
MALTLEQIKGMDIPVGAPIEISLKEGEYTYKPDSYIGYNIGCSPKLYSNNEHELLIAPMRYIALKKNLLYRDHSEEDNHHILRINIKDINEIKQLTHKKKSK